jgi:ketosteroid isomerase-like protein
MSPSDVEVLRRGWAAYSRGDIEAASHVLDRNVRWYGAGDEEEGCHNRDEAIAFLHQSRADGVTAELLDAREAGDRVLLVVQNHTPPEWGHSDAPHGELATVRDGKVVEIVVYPTVDEALAAAGDRT